MLSLEEIQKALDEFCPKYGATKWTLFGSYAHNMATEESDVDVLIELADKKNAFDIKLQIMGDLEDKLGKQVDVLIAPLPGKSLFVLENGVPIYMTGAERDKRLVPVVLRDIARIRTRLEGKTEEKFVADEDLQDAVSMRIVKLAERCKGFSQEFCDGVPPFPRREIIKVRNILSHYYGLDEDGNEIDVDYTRVWDFIQNIILPLETQLKQDE